MKNEAASKNDDPARAYTPYNVCDDNRRLDKLFPFLTWWVLLGIHQAMAWFHIINTMKLFSILNRSRSEGQNEIAEMHKFVKNIDLECTYFWIKYVILNIY